MAAYNVVYNPLWADNTLYPAGTTVKVSIDGVETTFTIGTDAFGLYEDAVAQANGSAILMTGDYDSRTLMGSASGSTNAVMDGNGGTVITDTFAMYGGVDGADLESESVKLTLKNMEWAGSDENNKLSIYGGSRVNESGLTAHQKSGTLVVEDSNLYADVRGGGFAGDNATGIQDTAEVTVKNSSISGYDDHYHNTWPGRIFGGGIAQGVGAKFYNGSTTVTCENVTGTTIRMPDGTISYEEGVRIYGAGQAYGASTYSETGTTTVSVSGADSSISEIYGGGISSGTAKIDVRAQVIVATSTNLTVSDAKVTDILAGGSNSNMFGYSRVGTMGETEGTTVITMTLNNVNAATAYVMGGSFADSFYYKHDGYACTAEVIGNIITTINGGTTGVFAGAGIALFANDEGTDQLVALPSSTVKGNVSTTINGGTFGDVVGGGIAISDDDKIKADATVTGDVNLEIFNATISGDLIAGGDAQGALSDAMVDGTATLTIGEGNTISGGIYGGLAATSVLKLKTGSIANEISGFTTISIDTHVSYTGTLLSATEIVGDGTLTVASGALDTGTLTNISVSTLDLTSTDTLMIDTLAAQTINLTVDSSLAAGSYILTKSGNFTAPANLTINGQDGVWFSSNKKFELSADSASVILTVSDVAAPEFIGEATSVQQSGSYDFQVFADAKGEGITYSLSGDGIMVNPDNPLQFSVANTLQHTTVTVTATDLFGRTAEQTVSINVVDYTAPVLTQYGIQQADGTYEFTVTADGTDNFGVTERLYRWAKTADGLNGDGVSTGTRLVLGADDAARTYYYQVMLKDAAGNSTGWSSIQNFTVAQVITDPGDTIVVAPEVYVVIDPDTGKEVATGVKELSGKVSGEEAPKATYKVLTETAAKTNIEINGLEKGEKVRVSIVDASGKKLKSVTVTANKNGSAAIKDFLTPSGDTFIQVESATKNAPIDYTLKLEQSYFEAASSNSTVATAEKITPTETPTETQGWVGYGDAVDTYKIETGKFAAALNLNLTSTEAKLKVTLRNENGKVIKSMTVTEKNFDKKEFSDILLDANTTTYIYVESGDKGKGKQNSSYTVSTSLEEFAKATNDSLLDPTKTAVGTTNSGWVGYSDAADFYQFEVAAGANIGLNLTGFDADYKAGKQLKVALYNLDTGKKVSLKSVKNDDFMNFATKQKNGLAAGKYCAVVSISNEKKYRSDYSLGIASI